MKKGNKSLFLYTALIFVVSIIMILIAFVGQENIQNMQPEDSSGMTITEKVNKLSEDNRILLEERISLTRKNEALTARFEIISKQNEIMDNLLKIEALLEEKKIDEAKLIYDTIDPTVLEETQKLHYDRITLKFNA